MKPQKKQDDFTEMQLEIILAIIIAVSIVGALFS